MQMSDSPPSLNGTAPATPSDGGGGTDALTVSGTPGTTVTNVTYSPGPDVTERNRFWAQKQQNAFKKKLGTEN